MAGLEKDTYPVYKLFLLFFLDSLHEYKKLLLLTKNSTLSPDSIYYVYFRNPGKVPFLIECVTETSGTYISINFIDTV